MDTTAKGIYFDQSVICNYCTDYLENSRELFDVSKLRDQKLNELVDKVKKVGKGKPYDCVVGVSGGVDSSWTLVKVKELGLRPLAVHMDNGWNSELAQNNIANLVNSLGIDLYTHVIEWNEYRNLMQAFFDADVLDVELLYDNAMLAVNYQMAQKYGLKHILSGSNHATEGIKIPPNWNWFKRDKRNIKAIAQKFGRVKLKTFPALSTIDFIYYEFIRGVKWMPFLDYIDYDKNKALDILENDFGYKRYPYKHYESIFTRFYQGYILPKKFNVDKRLMHLSSLVLGNQIERSEALEMMKEIAYPSQNDLEIDIEYFLKKMKWKRSDLEEYLKRPGVPHDTFPSEYRLWKILRDLYKKYG